MSTQQDDEHAKPLTRTHDYLRLLGVPDLPPLLSPFDPGYDLGTLVGHLDQSAHLMSRLKISMACWIVGREEVSRAKVDAARAHSVPTVSGGGPFEIAVAQGRLPEFLDLCADMGFDRIEAGQGFTDIKLDIDGIVGMAHARGLEVQFELGAKHDGAFDGDVVRGLLDKGRAWLDAGAAELVIEARESAQDVGLFDSQGRFNGQLADAFADAFGLGALVFEAPTKPSQFTMLDHFGPAVRLCNIRLEEVLRVEIYRRGMHSDAFSKPRLAPADPVDLEQRRRIDLTR
jgi:phosphosulfolactate synthase